MKKRTANLYVKMTAKSPVLFLALIFLSIVIILYITLSTKVDVIQTYDVRLEDNKIIVPETIHYKPDKVYIYENRNKVVYSIKVNPKDITYDDTSIIIPIKQNPFEHELTDVKVDIAFKKVTLFERVFLHGGKNE